MTITETADKKLTFEFAGDHLPTRALSQTFINHFNRLGIDVWATEPTWVSGNYSQWKVTCTGSLAATDEMQRWWDDQLFLGPELRKM